VAAGGNLLDPASSKPGFSRGSNVGSASDGPPVCVLGDYYSIDFIYDPRYIDEVVIEFRLETHSGVAPYLQIVQQVRNALRLGVLEVGDQLPTVKDVIGTVAINPNTVLKAYRELERDGLVRGRPGLGTFVVKGIDGPPPRTRDALRRGLVRWLNRAFEAGLDRDDIAALFDSTFRDSMEEETA
jgi:GntR family transcriptional regulator